MVQTLVQARLFPLREAPARRDAKCDDRDLTLSN